MTQICLKQSYFFDMNQFEPVSDAPERLSEPAFRVSFTFPFLLNKNRIPISSRNLYFTNQNEEDDLQNANGKDEYHVQTRKVLEKQSS